MYIKNNTDEWEFGDRLVGECKCNPNKTIELIYEGDGNCWKFPFKVGSFDRWYWNYKREDGISDVNIPKEYKLSQHHNWRRVPKGELDVSDTPQIPTDYEIGDKIRIRGFEYEISTIHNSDDLVLRKVEPKFKWAVGDLVEGYCQCTADKKILFMVTELDDYGYPFVVRDCKSGRKQSLNTFKNYNFYRSGDVSTWGPQFTEPYNKYTYRRVELMEVEADD